MGQHGRHVDGVAEMVGGGTGAQDGIDHLDGIVAAVMVNHQEIVVLDGLDDFPDIGLGELGGHIGGEQTGQGFGHDHAGGAGALLIGTDIGGEEIGGLAHGEVHHIGLRITVDQGLGDVHQAAGQGEGADDPGEHGPVGDERRGLFDGLDTAAGAPRAHLWNRKGAGLLLRGDDGAGNGGHLVVGNPYGAAEGLGLHRQIHKADRGGGVHPFGNAAHAFRLEAAVGDQVFDGDVQQADTGKRQNRQWLFAGGVPQGVQPGSRLHRNRTPLHYFSALEPLYRKAARSAALLGPKRL